MDASWLDLNETLLDRLRGKLSLMQSDAERAQVVGDVLEAVYAQHTNGFPRFSNKTEHQAFMDTFLSYELIEEFLADPRVEDIMINGTDFVFVHRTGEGLVKTNRRFETMREVALLVKKLVVFAGRSEVDPINDVELMGIRGRVNIIHSPLGPQITITRGKPQPLTILQLIEQGMLSFELAAQLWLYVEGLRVRPANIILAGAPGAGKTTLLNALLSFIPSSDRLVVIEDTLELNTRFLTCCSRLESCRRTKTPELVKNSLRMRPDRILVGEVRGAEARDLMTAMSLGKYCMGTLHASTARETVLRLQNEPMNVPSILVSLVDVFVMVRKLRVNGKATRVVAEVVETAGMEQQTVLLSQVWQYDPKQERTTENMPGSAYRDHLAMESGLTTVTILNETIRRAAVLRTMHQSGRFADIDAVTAFFQGYSESPEEAISALGLKLLTPKRK